MAKFPKIPRDMVDSRMQPELGPHEENIESGLPGELPEPDIGSNMRMITPNPEIPGMEFLDRPENDLRTTRPQGVHRTSARDPLFTQLEALGDPETQPQQEPQVGLSETARQLDGEGYFDGLARQFGHERESRTRRAVEESQGFSFDSISNSVREFFNRPEGQEHGPMSRRGVDRLNEFGMVTSPRAQQLAQEELETAQVTAPRMRGVAGQYPTPDQLTEARRDPLASALGQELPPAGRFGGDQVSGSMDFWRRVYGSAATHQEERLRRAQAMVRGEAPLPAMEQWRSLVETGVRTIPDFLAAYPLQHAGAIVGYATGGEPTDNRLYKWGQEIEKAAKAAFPADPARQFEFAHVLTQGISSTAVFAGQGAVLALLGAGAKGQLATIALTGMAAQSAPEFARVTEALKKGDATERDRIIVLLANSVLGLTEAGPFAGLGGATGRLRQSLTTGVTESIQETVQTGGSNIARQTYLPGQDAYEGVWDGALVGFLSGSAMGGAMGGRREEQAPIVEARAGGVRTQTEPAPATQAPAEAVAPTPVPEAAPSTTSDPHGLERFALPPESVQEPQTEVSAPVVPETETPASESLGRIAAMADRPSDTDAKGPAVLPPDVLEYLRETNPELAERYVNSDSSVTAPDVAAAPPLPTLRERLEKVLPKPEVAVGGNMPPVPTGPQQAWMEDIQAQIAAKTAHAQKLKDEGNAWEAKVVEAEIKTLRERLISLQGPEIQVAVDPAVEAMVDENLPVWQAELSQLLTRLNVAAPLSDTDARAVFRHMARDRLNAQEATERYGVERYEIQRQRLGQPETLGTAQAQATTAPAGGADRQPAGARPDGQRAAQLGTERSRPAAEGTASEGRGTERGVQQDSEPTRQQREFFSRLLKQKKPLKWSEVQTRLRVTPEQMESLRQEALANGLLRQDRHGVYRRTAKVQAQAVAGMESLAHPNASVPPAVRVDNAVRIREAQTGKPVSPLVRSLAIRLLARLGHPQFTTMLAEIKKDAGLKVADVRDLAALVGYLPTTKSTKPEAFRLIANRHVDHKAYLARQQKSAAVGQELAAFAQHAVEGADQRADLDALGFYSGAVEAARKIPQEKGTPEQMRAMLVKAGAKEAELKAVNFDDWLATRGGGDSAVKSGTARNVQVTKSEIISFLESNRVEVRESVYGDVPAPTLVGIYHETQPVPGAKGPTKWASHSLDPSNPTYRETVIHLPDRVPTFEEWYGNPDVRSSVSSEAEARNLYSALAGLDGRLGTVVDFRSGHFSEPNVIAHARTSLQKDSDGRVVFLIDELQSDWGQGIRERGVRDDASIAEARTERDRFQVQADTLEKEMIALVESKGFKESDQGSWDQFFDKLTDQGDKRALELSAQSDTLTERLSHYNTILNNADRGVPGHPLVNTTDQWVTTALRRLIAQAVAAGADKIAFVPGQVQIDRGFGDFAAKVGGLRYFPGNDRMPATLEYLPAGSIGLDAWKTVPDAPHSPERLRELVGKEMSEALLAQPQKKVEGPRSVPWHTLTDLKSVQIGGHGMRATYDGIYPRALGKILGKLDKSVKQESEELRSSVDGLAFLPKTQQDDRALSQSSAAFYLKEAKNNRKRAIANVKADLNNAAGPHHRAALERVIGLLEGRDIHQPILFHTFPLTQKVKESIQARGQALFSFASQRSGNEEGEDLGKPHSTAAVSEQGASPARGRPYTDIFRSRYSEVATAIQRELERMLPADVPVRMMDRLMVGPAEAIERVSISANRDMLLEVALSQGPDTAKLKGFHGVTHVLRESGLWSDAEWQLLVDRANKTDAAERLNVPMTYEGRTIPMIEGYRTFYTQQAKGLGFSSAEVAADVAEKINQELVAALAESWAEGTSYGAKIDSLLARIAKFFEAIRNALNGLGFQTVDDVFAKVVSGEVGRRAEGGRREPTFDPFPVKVSPEEYYLSSEEGLAALDAMVGSASGETLMAFSEEGDLMGPWHPNWDHGAWRDQHPLPYLRARNERPAGLGKEIAPGVDLSKVILRKDINKEYMRRLMDEYRSRKEPGFGKPNMGLEADQLLQELREFGFADDQASLTQAFDAYFARNKADIAAGRLTPEQEVGYLHEMHRIARHARALDIVKTIQDSESQTAKRVNAVKEYGAFVIEALVFRDGSRYQQAIDAVRRLQLRKSGTGDQMISALQRAGLTYSEQMNLDLVNKFIGEGHVNINQIAAFLEGKLKIAQENAARSGVKPPDRDGGGQSLPAFSPDSPSRPFPIPGFNGSVEERVKSSGERIRTYNVNSDISLTATESDQSPLQRLHNVRVFHASSRAFDRLDIGQAGSSHRGFGAIWGSPSRRYAEDFGKNIREVDFNYGRPFVWDMADVKGSLARAQASIPGYDLPRNPDGRALADQPVAAAAAGPDFNPGPFIEGLKAAGFDALEIRNTRGNISEIAVFSQSQVVDGRGGDQSAKSGTRAIVSEQPDGSWELSFFKASSDAPILDVVAAIESDIGNRLSPKGWLTPQGYRYWQSADPQSVRYHQNAGELFGGMYASPRAVEFAQTMLAARHLEFPEHRPLRNWLQAVRLHFRSERKLGNHLPALMAASTGVANASGAYLAATGDPILGASIVAINTLSIPAALYAGWPTNGHIEDIVRMHEHLARVNRPAEELAEQQRVAAQLNAIFTLRRDLPIEALASERNEQMFSFSSGPPPLPARFGFEKRGGLDWYRTTIGPHELEVSYSPDPNTPGLYDVEFTIDHQNDDADVDPVHLEPIFHAVRQSLVDFIVARQPAVLTFEAQGGDRRKTLAWTAMGTALAKRFGGEFSRDRQYGGMMITFPPWPPRSGLSTEDQIAQARAAARGGGDEVVKSGTTEMSELPIDPSQEGSPVLMAAFRGEDSSDDDGGTSGEVRGLADIIADLKETLGLTTTQGRYGLTVVDRAGGRRFRFPAQPNVRGQYDRHGGVARIKIATDIDAIAHEGGHHLERVFGADLDVLKQEHAEELGTQPAPNTPLPKLTPAGFSGMELDAGTQGVLVKAATAMREWRALGVQRGEAKSKSRVFGRGVDDAAFQEAAARAAVATGVLERRLGASIAQSLIGDILGDARIGIVIGQSPLRRAITMGTSGTLLEIAPEDMAAYVAERYSRNGTPQPRNVPTPTPLQISEGFAEFFRRYIVDPDSVKREMPGVYAAFEDFLDATDPAMLENLEKLQLTALSADYKAYRETTSTERLVADVASTRDQTGWEQVKDFYQTRNQTERVSQWLSTLSYNVTDLTNPALKIKQELNRRMFDNGVRDADGRPITLRLQDDFHYHIRMFPQAFKVGHEMVVNGITDYGSLTPTGPSEHDAIAHALGGTGRVQWTEKSIDRFGGYITARTGIVYWALYARQKGLPEADAYTSVVNSYYNSRDVAQMLADGSGAPQFTGPPHRMSFGEFWSAIQDMERANPTYRRAAEMYHEFEHRKLTLKWQAGLLNDAQYQTYSKRKEFYSPFSRKFDDSEGAFVPPGATSGGFFTKFKQIKGSQRSVINPLATTARDTYQLAEVIQRNDMVRALAELGDMAGPGSGEIVERIQKEETMAANQRAFERVAETIVAMGYDEADARALALQMEGDFQDSEVHLLYTPDHLGPKRPITLPFFEKGERKLIRFNDVEAGQRLLAAMNTLGRGMSSTLLEIVAAPAAVLRAGVIMHPAYMLGNLAGDMQMNYILTGAPMGLTHLRGAWHELSGYPKFRRFVQSFGIKPSDLAQMQDRLGLIGGGQLTASIAERGGNRRNLDLVHLRNKGYQVVDIRAVGGVGAAVGGGVTGGMLGTAAGPVIGGIIGGATGTALGAEIGGRLGERAVRRLRGDLGVVALEKDLKSTRRKMKALDQSAPDYASKLASLQAVRASQMQAIKELREADTAISTSLARGTGKVVGGLVGGLTGATTGAVWGPAMGPVVGATLGVSAGAMAARLVFGSGAEGAFAKMSEFVETAGRRGTAEYATKRALAFDSSLPTIDAIREGVFTANDALPFDRRGFMTGALMRMVPFFNGNVQGISKMYRQAWMVEGDRGHLVTIPTLQGGLLGAGGAAAATAVFGGPVGWAMGAGALTGAALGRWALGRTDVDSMKMWLRHLLTRRHANGLTEFEENYSRADEKRMRAGTRAWIMLSIIGVMGAGLSMMSGGSDSPEEYDDVNKQVKNTHWVFKIHGVWMRLKRFEFGLPAIITEALFDAFRKGDPRAAERVRDGIVATHVPPILPHMLREMGAIRTGIDPQTGRPVTPYNLREQPPHLRYNAYTSEFAKQWAQALRSVGVTASPVAIDYALQTQAGYWGREVQNFSNYFYGRTRDSADPRDVPLLGPVINRFTWDSARSTRSLETFYEAMGRDASPFRQASAGYNRLLRGGLPDQVRTHLADLPDDQRVYAIVMGHFKKSERNLHPLNRADGVVRLTQDMQREMVDRGLISTEGGERGNIIPLAPAKRNEVAGILLRLQNVEVWNALRDTGRPGWANRSMRDPQPLLDELQASSPAVYEEMLRRRRTNKLDNEASPIGDYAQDRAEWTEIAKRAREMIETENMMGLRPAWDKKFRRRRSPSYRMPDEDAAPILPSQGHSFWPTAPAP